MANEKDKAREEQAAREEEKAKARAAGDTEAAATTNEDSLNIRQQEEQDDFRHRTPGFTTVEGDAGRDVVQQDADTTTRPVASTSEDFDHLAGKIGPDDVGTVEDIDPSRAVDNRPTSEQDESLPPPEKGDGED